MIMTDRSYPIFWFFVRHSRGGGNPIYSYPQAVIQTCPRLRSGVRPFGVMLLNKPEFPYPIP